MPWRLMFFIVILGIVVFFAGFNITNVSDISFGFYTITDVPIFISLFVAFLVGTLVMIPFRVGRKRRGDTKPSRSARIEPQDMPEIPSLPDEEDVTEKPGKK